MQYFLRKTFVKFVDDLKDKWGNARVQIDEVFTTTKNLTSYLNDNHLVDIQNLIKESQDSKRGFNKLKRKVQQLVGLNHDLEYLVKDFSKAILPLKNRNIEKDLLPITDLTPFCKIYQKKLKGLERDLKDMLSDTVGLGDLRVDLEDIVGEESLRSIRRAQQQTKTTPCNPKPISATHQRNFENSAPYIEATNT